jgi:hypothetical protein
MNIVTRKKISKIQINSKLPLLTYISYGLILLAIFISYKITRNDLLFHRDCTPFRTDRTIVENLIKLSFGISIFGIIIDFRRHQHVRAAQAIFLTIGMAVAVYIGLFFTAPWCFA